MRRELTSRKDQIASFLRSLPDASVKIEGKFSTNELFINGKKVVLSKSLKYRNHSPTGFNWGYGGSGPAQSALAILLEFADSNDACTFYQDFKFGWVAGLPRTDFVKVINLRELMATILFK